VPGGVGLRELGKTNPECIYFPKIMGVCLCLHLHVVIFAQGFAHVFFIGDTDTHK